MKHSMINRSVQCRKDTDLTAGGSVKTGSRNVFAHLGLPNAEKLIIKSGLVVEIRKAMRSLGLTQPAAAIRIGATPRKVADMMRGDFTNWSERALRDCLSRLDVKVPLV
jgi:predicted XRE-type DNA-binding protein